MEEQLIRKIKGGIFGIKNKTKTPVSANLGPLLNRLKEINEGQYDSLLAEYKQAVLNFHNK